MAVFRLKRAFYAQPFKQRNPGCGLTGGSQARCGIARATAGAIVAPRAIHPRPVLLVHGPLTFAPLMDLFHRERPDTILKSFAVRARYPGSSGTRPRQIGHQRDKETRRLAAGHHPVIEG
ncbi:MAG: hypothetical protein O3C34_09100 [Proteobacteria bacterium]|nr:hypothetical protein [Pseudomonadota bacterium]